MGPEPDVEGDEHRVEEVDEHSAHHGDGKVGHGGGAVLLGDHLHIGHGVGGGAHGEADEAGGHHRRVVIAAHDPEHDEVGE